MSLLVWWYLLRPLPNEWYIHFGAGIEWHSENEKRMKFLVSRSIPNRYSLDIVHFKGFHIDFILALWLGEKVYLAFVSPKRIRFASH